MTIGWLSRRTLLASSSVLAGLGLFGRSAASADLAMLQSTLQTATLQFQPSVLALVQNGVAQLAQTESLLNKLGLSPALFAALTNLQPGLQAGGGMKHKGLVRRVRNPAMIKNPNNPHFLPQGVQFSAAELKAYAPQAFQGRGLI